MKNAREGGGDVLGHLREVIVRMAEEREPARLVAQILDQAITLVGAERGFLIVLAGEAATPHFEVASARNLDRAQIERPEFEVSRSIVKRVAASGEAELLCDASEDRRTKNVTSIRDLQLRSVLCVPLRLAAATLGVLYVDHRQSKGEFDAGDLETLQTFAVPAAVLLDAARRTQELAQRVETIERLRADLAERYRERTREVNRLRSREAPLPGPADGLPGLVARSPSMRQVALLVRKAAPSDAPVLIHGESGVGKEIVARAVHALSGRTGPFHAENCGALADPLLETELFGHERGAFTGAAESRPGIFEAARGGTILLDEVGEMSLGLQTKLLRVLQERQVRRVGGREQIAIDVRIVAATHRDLEGLIAAGKFRLDLYYRLKVVPVEIPPLRERPDDLAALLEHYERSLGIVLEPQAREVLLAHSWPGNVRELENELRRVSVLVGRGGVVRPGLLAASRPRRPPSDEQSAEPPISGVWRLKDLEREMILRALRAANGNRSEASRLLGLPKSSLYDRLAKHGINVADGS